MSHPHAPMPAPAGADVVPPERPVSIVTALQLWVGVIVCQLVWLGGSYPGLREEVLPMVRDAAKQPNGPKNPEAFATAMTIVWQVIGGLFLTAITALVMFFVFRGAPWARLVLGWMSAFLVVMLFFDLLGQFFGVDELTGEMTSGWPMIFRILGGVAALGAMIALMNADSVRYCREMSDYRLRKRLRR
ncbi:MAG: hypothetical protein QM658_06560 [Gordonia sp. (in: high G+C Gram-positive bacteria)]